jgi:transcriptional regulator with XRE-family HTH domain
MEISQKKLYVCIADSCMSFNELSEASGVPKTTLSAIVNKRRNPKPMTVGKIARALNVSVAELIEQ